MKPVIFALLWYTVSLIALIAGIWIFFSLREHPEMMGYLAIGTVVVQIFIAGFGFREALAHAGEA